MTESVDDLSAESEFTSSQSTKQIDRNSGEDDGDERHNEEFLHDPGAFNFGQDIGPQRLL